MQLGSEFDGDVASCQCTEAGGDAVHGSRMLGEGFDAGAARGDRGESVVRDLHTGVVARHADDVIDGDRADTHYNLIHSTIVHASV